MLNLKASNALRVNTLVNLLTDVTPQIGKGKIKRHGKAPRWRGDPRNPVARVDIVSEGLCDDFINYLSPTLEQHRGCTIVDLQPGACLFSSKLHEYLRPRRHILAEPEDHYYEPFIKPLLDQPGSTYRYTQLNIAHSTSYWTELQRIRLDSTLCPERAALSDDDPKLRQLDPSLLLVGNLARQPKAQYSTHTVPQAQLILYQLAYQALANQHLHNAGLVRMLLWVPEVYKTRIFAILPWTRSGFNLELDMGLNMSEAVSVQSLDAVHQSRVDTYERRNRSGLFDQLTNQKVSEKMQNARLSIPPNRELQLLASESQPANEPVEAVSLLTPNVKSVSELEDKIASTSSRIKELYPWMRNVHSIKKTTVSKLEYPQVVKLVEDFTKGPSQLRVSGRVVVLLDLTMRMVNIEANFKALEDGCDDPEALQHLHGRIQDLESEANELFERAPVVNRHAVRDLLEDQIAYFLSPSILTFNERAYEPLKANSSEFWPQQDLSLLDIIPKATDLAIPGLANREEATRFCSELLQMFFVSKRSSLPQALEKVAVNAAKDLIPMVPAITDARRGGRLNPNNLSVCMITEEMVEGLVKAFFEWPFRPQSWELALANERIQGADESEMGEHSQLDEAATTS